MVKIELFCIGDKLPAWQQQGIAEYQKRLKTYCDLQIHQFKHVARHSQSTQSAMIKEGKQLLSKLKPAHYCIALDSRGTQWNTEDFAKQLDQWQSSHHHLALLIGGADGLTPACLKHAHQKWSLSKLTFTHSLARLLVLEQLYRGYCYLSGHPYHK